MELVQNQNQQRDMIQIEREYFNVLKHRIADLYMKLDESEAEKRMYLDKIQKLENEKSKNSATG